MPHHESSYAKIPMSYKQHAMEKLAFLKGFLLPGQIVISIVLILLILVQNKDGGLSATFGGGEGFQATKRGAEKVLFNATIVFAILFMVNAFLSVFLH